MYAEILTVSKRREAKQRITSMEYNILLKSVNYPSYQ